MRFYTEISKKSQKALCNFFSVNNIILNIVNSIAFLRSKEVQLYVQNARSAVRALLLVSRYHTHTEEQTELGSQM